MPPSHTPSPQNQTPSSGSVDSTSSAEASPTVHSEDSSSFEGSDTSALPPQGKSDRVR